MSKVFTALSVSVDGYITGGDPGAGRGLGDATMLFDWYFNGDTPSTVFGGFRLSADSARVFDAAAGRVGASLAGRNTTTTPAGPTAARRTRTARRTQPPSAARGHHVRRHTSCPRDGDLRSARPADARHDRHPGRDRHRPGDRRRQGRRTDGRRGRDRRARGGAARRQSRPCWRRLAEDAQAVRSPRRPPR
jgi:hypothetical protein